MKNTGYWIPVEMTPEEIAEGPLPKQGDEAVIEYDDEDQPIHGSARITGSSFQSAKSFYKSPEYGESFFYSPMFGL